MRNSWDYPPVVRTVTCQYDKRLSKEVLFAQDQMYEVREQIPYLYATNELGSEQPIAYNTYGEWYNDAEFKHYFLINI